MAFPIARHEFMNQTGKFTNDDMQTPNGRKDQLAGKIQERYGMAREE